MKKYLVVEACNVGELTRRVEVFLERGWELQGGVCAVGGGSTGTGSAYYFQAMYREVVK